MPIQNILITASINSLVSESYGQRTYIASTDNQSFSIETTTGSYAGAWPNFISRNLTSSNSASNTTTGLIVNITQSWSESIVTPLGIIPRIHNTMEEFVNGEFSGSRYTVSNGNLTDEYCQPILKPDTTEILYLIPPENAIPSGIRSSSYINNIYQGDQLFSFYNSDPTLGLIHIYVRKNFDNLIGDYFITIEKIKISKSSYVDGSIWIDQTLSLQELKRILWYDSDIFDTIGGNIILKILNITEKPSCFLYDVECSIVQTNGSTTNTWIQATSPVNVNNNTHFFVLEPYLNSAFINSDCDVLQNNATQFPSSRYQKRVLYDDGSTIPSNINQIIAGTAEPAEVNNYIYNASDSTQPRYSGVRSESPNFNQNSTFGGYGTLPNVESLQTYFAYYDYITSSFGEVIDKSLIHILYLIDKNGDVLTPTLSSSYYYNLIDNFESNKNVNINLNTTDGVSNIGLKNTARAGVIPLGICASQTGSDATPINTIYFGNNTSTVNIPAYASLVNGITPYQGFPIVAGGGTHTIDLVTIVQNGTPNVNISLANNNFEILTTSNATSLNLKLEGSLGISKQNNNPPSNIVTATIYCQESPDGSSWTNIDQKNVSITYGTATYINLNFTSFPAIAGKYYRLRLYHGSGYFSMELRNGKISIMQNPLPTTSGTITSPYWTTGSNSKNILTSSGGGVGGFGLLYSLYKAYQLNEIGSGYKNFLEFDPKPSDEIRFEGDEYQTYQIQEVISTGSLYLVLDRDVNNTNINSFLIRRYVPHPNFVLLDWNGNEYFSGDGFIFSEYSSLELTQNFNNIIAKLKEKGII